MARRAPPEAAMVPSGLRIRRTRAPQNVESDARELARSYLTPASNFFVRSHAKAPRLDAGRHTIAFGGLVARPLRLTAGDLEGSYPRRAAVATLVCAGNRRAELRAVREVVGEIPWGPAAVSTALFEGVRLADVLGDAGPLRGARHAVFEGADGSGGRPGFGGSIPIKKAGAPETLIALRMNGRPLDRDHGAPARLVVPGCIGARSVKWLSRVELRRTPSQNPAFTRAYRRLPRASRGTPRAFARAAPIQENPVNCAVLEPADGDTLEPGRATVRGFAVGGGAARVARVEVSADAGRTWRRARFTSPSRRFAWALWKADVEVSLSTRALWARAFDSQGHTQPQSLAAAWNLKGYTNNAVHRVRVRVEPARAPGGPSRSQRRNYK